MNRTILVSLVGVALVALAFYWLKEEPRAFEAKPESGISASRKLVILKLDDVIDGQDGEVVSKRWQRVADYLEKRNIKASFGVIGYSLVDDNPAYFQWIRERADRGLIECWNHGFLKRTKEDPTGEFERSFEEQLWSLRMTDSLARAKLGLTFTAWGPHWSDTNQHTDRALAEVPSIRFTFGYPPEEPVYFTGVRMLRRIDMEYPTHHPDFERFVAAYRGKEETLDAFFLQGHPESWDKKRWKEFVRIVKFLQAEGVRFITPSEYLKMRSTE